MHKIKKVCRLNFNTGQIDLYPCNARYATYVCMLWTQLDVICLEASMKCCVIDQTSILLTCIHISKLSSYTI